ncbi:hypothetical protein RND71_022953 [Anisodus tanguticus]|uniref:F-box associated beta-propeller type 1 domain-containing protein n=1 Tax=Anisodus tanguticus TaxID=243964 RepID=A0AAE1RT12_9SOLA|nr:hypothetical protein RND71_022953 [Anisodus tanguticus]
MGEAANIKLGLGIAMVLMMVFAAEGLTDIQRCLRTCKGKCGNDQECYSNCVDRCVVPVNVQNQVHYCKIGCFSEKCSKYDVNDKQRETCLEDCSNKDCYFKKVLLKVNTPDFNLKNCSFTLPDPRDGYYVMYGFGYDELHDDYKVMVICNNLSHDGSHFIEVNIYSLKSDSWRITCEDWSGVLPTRWGTLVNGKLHWTTPATRVGVYNLKDVI